MITGLILEMLRQQFSDAQQLQEIDLRDFIWQPGAATGILIGSLQRWTGDLTEKRPAVIVTRNSAQSRSIVLGDLSRQDERGFESFVTQWIGSHTAFCLHDSGAGAEILADVVQSYLHDFHPSITQYLALHKWRVIEVGPPSKIEESRQGFVVPVTVGWAYEVTWRLELESLKVRRITLSRLVDGMPLD